MLTIDLARENFSPLSSERFLPNDDQNYKTRFDCPFHCFGHIGLCTHPLISPFVIYSFALKQSTHLGTLTLATWACDEGPTLAT